MSTKKAAKTPSPAGLSTFRNLYDTKTKNSNKVRQAFSTMLKESPEAFREEKDLAEMAGLSKEEIRGLREEFDKYIVEVPQRGRSTAIRVWFADAKVATEARKPPTK